MAQSWPSTAEMNSSWYKAGPWFIGGAWYVPVGSSASANRVNMLKATDPQGTWSIQDGDWDVGVGAFRLEAVEDGTDIHVCTTDYFVLADQPIKFRTFDTLTDTWDDEVTVDTPIVADNAGFVMGLGLASNGDLVVVAMVDREKIHGTPFARFGVYESTDNGVNWTNTVKSDDGTEVDHTHESGLQIDLNDFAHFVASVDGSDDRVFTATGSDFSTLTQRAAILNSFNIWDDHTIEDDGSLHGRVHFAAELPSDIIAVFSWDGDHSPTTITQDNVYEGTFDTHPLRPAITADPNTGRLYVTFWVEDDSGPVTYSLVTYSNAGGAWSLYITHVTGVTFVSAFVATKTSGIQDGKIAIVTEGPDENMQYYSINLATPPHIVDVILDFTC